MDIWCHDRTHPGFDQHVSRYFWDCPECEREFRVKRLPRPERIEDAHLITHKGCMDGATCAILFRRSGGKRENVHFVAAGMIERFAREDPLFQSGEFLIVADCSMNVPKYADTFEKRGNLVFIDHHKTSTHLVDRPWAWVDAETNGGNACGCVMLLRYLIEHKLWKGSTVEVAFALLVDDQDRWINKVPESDDLSLLMTFTGQDEFIERFLDLDKRFGMELLAQFVWTETELEILKHLKARRATRVENAVKHVRTKLVEDGGRWIKIGYVISSMGDISVLLNEILKAHPDIDVAAQVNFELGTVSLRSRPGGVDVADLAKGFGGGGHATASGHRIPEELTNYVVGEVHHGS